jgi:hypothetical protein
VRSSRQRSLIGQEKGRGVKLTPSSNGEALKIKVDGCLITNAARCDCLYFYKQSNNKHFAFLVELKGNNYPDALAQFISTKNHPDYAELHTVAKPCAVTAVAIVAEKAKTNRPKKDEWEDEHGLRLHVVPLKADNTYDLRELVK